METTPWHTFGHASGNEKCRDCMVHSGHEATAVSRKPRRDEKVVCTAVAS
jgi:hypothetical protein